MINMLFLLVACNQEATIKDSAIEAIDDDSADVDNLTYAEIKYPYGNYPAKDCSEYNEWVYELSQNQYIEQPIAQVEVQHIIPKFELMDEWGQSVTNYDFCHMAILIVTGAAWCEPCQAYRAEAQRFYDLYADKGLVIISLLGESSDVWPIPDVYDLEEWRGDSNYIILADPGWRVSHQGYHTGVFKNGVSLIAPGYVATIINGYPTEADIEVVLPENYTNPR